MSPRSVLLSAVLAALAAPAAAQYSRSGSLNWRFDDLSVDSGAGRFRRSGWYQGYDLGLAGPLVRPAFGDLQTGAAFSDGTDINQAVNLYAPHQQRVNVNVRADLFSPRVRQYLRLSPNFSRSLLQQSGEVGGRRFSRDLTNTSWGAASGLSLPRLPALSYSRQVNTLRDPSEFSPARQAALIETKNATYTTGPARLYWDDQTSVLEDRLGQAPRQRDGQRRLGLETTMNELKKLPLQSFYFRGEQTRNTANGTPVQKQFTSNLNLFTNKARLGGWEHYAGYWGDLQRDDLARSRAVSHSGALYSNRELRSGSLTNTVNISRATGRTASENASEALNASQAFFAGRFTTNAGGSLGWSRSGANRFLTDGLDALATLSPRRRYSLFVSAQTSGSEPLAGDGGGRTNRYGTGANAPLGPNADLGLRGYRTLTRDYGAHSGSVNDQATLQVTASPMEQVYARAAYNVGVLRSSRGGRSRTQDVQAGADYNPRNNVSFSAAATWAASAYTASVSARYRVGKTQFGISYEHRELSTPATFSHLSVSVSRAL